MVVEVFLILLKSNLRLFLRRVVHGLMCTRHYAKHTSNHVLYLLNWWTKVHAIIVPREQSHVLVDINPDIGKKKDISYSKLNLLNELSIELSS